MSVAKICDRKGCSNIVGEADSETRNSANIDLLLDGEAASYSYDDLCDECLGTLLGLLMAFDDGKEIAIDAPEPDSKAVSYVSTQEEPQKPERRGLSGSERFKNSPYLKYVSGDKNQDDLLKE